MSVISSGIVSISSGVTSTGLEVIQTGAIHVLNDGWAESVSAADGGSIVVSKGGIMYVCTLAGGTATVLNGGWAESVAVRNGGLYLLNSGASTHDTLISSGGSARVGRDVMATGMTVLEGGVLHVDPAGYARAPVVSTGGAVHVSAAGIVDKARVYGSVFVSSGGSFNSSTVNPDAEVIVAAGGICSKVQVHGGTFSVESGALVRGTVVDSGGQFLLLGPNETGGSSASGSSGGARETTVNSDGTMTVNSGAVADSTTVNSGGRLDVSGGGTAGSTTVNSGGRLNVSGGSANAIVENGGYVGFKNGAEVSFASNTFSGLVLSNASATVHSGTTANSTTVNNGGRLEVFSGGTANDTAINSGGTLYVSSGGTANDTMVNSGGILTLSSGGTAHNITINSGGEVKGSITIISGYTLTIFSGGRVGNTIVDGGIMFISSGATAFPKKFLRGSVFGISLTNSQEYTVSSGCTIHDTTVSNGKLYITDGGTAVNTTINSKGVFVVSNGGTVDQTFINSGGSYRISDGATANNTIISGRSGLSRFNFNKYVSNNYTNAVNSGYGVFEVYSGGIVNNTTVSTGGLFVVYDGGTVNDTVISGLEGSAYSDNQSSFLAVSSGGLARNTTVGKGGSLTILSGGEADGIIVSSGARVELGGKATNVVWTPCIGTVYVVGGAEVSFASELSGVYYGSLQSGLLSHGEALESKTVGSKQVMYVMSGGTATNITNQWDLYVWSGGVLNDVKGGLWVRSGGTATKINASSGDYLGFVVASDTYVQGKSNGVEFEMKDAFISGYMVDYGKLSVSSGGVAKDTNVTSQGWLEVFSGGAANGITVNSRGWIEVFSGGTATGRIVLNYGADVSMFEGAILDFDLTQVEAGAEEALVNDLSIIKGTPKYSLTVDADSWKPGSCVYSLAKGAENFASTITVVDKMSGDELGVLTVGETVSIGDHDFTLNLNDSTLSVTILTPIPAPENLIGTKDRVSWDPIGAEQYVIEYSTDHFEHAIQATASTTAIDMLALPAGTYQWRVRVDDDNSDWAVGEDIVSDNRSDTPKVLVSNEDGCGDLFFATPNGTWDITYFAMNVGSINDWEGTKEIISARGRNRIQNLYFGSSDPNILCLTDDANGDSIFVDDIYTELPDEIEENMARLYRIREIRAGAGDDIVDMTSQQFEYTGDGLTIRGGDGDDVIWANKGGNRLFGDAGNDRIVGASGNDVIAGGIGNDRMHGGGGSDVFTFCENWGMDTVEQLGTGTVTLWFAESESRITASELDGNSVFTNADGTASVTVKGFALADIMVKYGDDGSDDYAALASAGAFFDATTERIFEESGKGILASL